MTGRDWEHPIGQLFEISFFVSLLATSQFDASSSSSHNTKNGPTFLWSRHPGIIAACIRMHASARHCARHFGADWTGYGR